MIDSPQHDDRAASDASRGSSNQDFDRQPALSSVETDRYCTVCGYNLRTQVVRRDARTELLLCRCPECGRLDAVLDGVTVGRVWLQRLGTLGLFSWILTVLAMTIGFCAVQVAITVLMFDELTTYQYATAPVPPSLTSPGGAQVYRSGGTITIIQPGGTLNVSKRVVREKIEHYELLMFFLHVGAFLVGFLLMMLFAVACHHWRKWGYLIPASIIPILLGWLIWYPWTQDFPNLADWSAGKIIRLNAAFLAGGWTAIVFGRAAARTLVRLLLPPRLQQVLAFLWLADGKRPPGIAIR